MNYSEIFEKYKCRELFGRYIHLQMIEPVLQAAKLGKLQVLGKSVQGAPIYSYTIGNGPIRLLLWSQMHGNESTATKALCDLIQFLESKSDISRDILERFTICLVPMLNPDGALAYTRNNANDVDLNRDFVERSQPETRVLIQLSETFKPDFCFNLHDQRSIFGVGKSGKPASVSLLAPAFDLERGINAVRAKAILLLVGINRYLQTRIPGQVARFDDSFNLNCAGDNFQANGIPTVLIETGHYADDYDRERVRGLLLESLLSAFEALYANDIVSEQIEEYLNITENMPVFFDIVYKNVTLNYDGKEIIANFASHYTESLINNKIAFEARISVINQKSERFGHLEYDFENKPFKSKMGSLPIIGEIANFSIGNDIKIVNGLREV